MTKVKLIYDMPRTLRDWPPIGTVMELEDHEAENLIYARCAELVSDEPEFEEPEVEDEPEFEESDDDFDNDFESDDFDSEVDEPARPPRSSIVKKPRTVDSKSKWLAYARSKGYTGDDTITKNRLVAEYAD